MMAPRTYSAEAAENAEKFLLCDLCDLCADRCVEEQSMNRKVTVVGGAGNVGATVARGVADKQLADVVVIDIAEQKASGIALDMLEPTTARLEHARTLVEYGGALRRSKQRVEARERLRDAVEIAHRLGALALVVQANDELAATGARPRKVVQTGLETLTASERRVAQLAANDMTNKDIAQALFVTVKTVEVHLSSVYRKLEITSRRQLAPALAVEL